MKKRRRLSLKPLAVSNTSFLSLMHELDYLGACKALFKRIIVPRAIYEEIIGRPDGGADKC